MEREQQHAARRDEQGWEVCPRDGRAVLVVNTRLLDAGLGPVGGSIRLDRTELEVAEQIGRIVGTVGTSGTTWPSTSWVWARSCRTKKRLPACWRWPRIN